MEPRSVDSRKMQANLSLDLHIGARLRMRRRFRLISEHRLADALAINRADLVEMEEGRAQIDAKTLLAAGEILGVNPRYFFQGFEGPGAKARSKTGPSWLREVDLWFIDEIAPHERLFLKLAHRLIGNFEAARDLVHDAYAAIFADEKWRGVSNPRAYVSQIVGNLARDQLRRNKIVPMDQYADIDQFGLEDLSPDALTIVADRERLRSVIEAIEKLPKACRQVFIMRKIEDITPREIAKQLGLTIGTVEQHLIHGMVHLHRNLEKDRKGMQLKVWLANQAAGTSAPKDARDLQR